MGIFTPLSSDDRDALAAAYDIQIAAVEPLEAGSVNSNFRIRAVDGAIYFARIYEEQGEDGARAERALLEALARRGLAVVAPLPEPAGIGLSVQRKPLALFPWVEGEILCQARVTPVHAQEVGRSLATLHLATEGVGALPEGRFRLEDLERRLRTIDESAPEYAEVTALVRERLGVYAEGRDGSLPEGLVHGDLFRDNVLWRGERITALLDFESASRGPFVFDLAVCLLAWCYGDAFERDHLASMLRGYHSVRKLSAAEQAALRSEGAIAALRFATTRITDFSMRAGPSEVPRRSYRRFLERLEAIEGGVFEEVLPALEGSG